MTIAGRTCSWASTTAHCAFDLAQSVEQLVGFENHLGACAVDLDGDRDIVSIGWDAAEAIHVWRNDAAAPSR